MIDEPNSPPEQKKPTHNKVGRSSTVRLTGMAVAMFVVIVGLAVFINSRNDEPGTDYNQPEDYAYAQVQITNEGFYPQTIKVSPNTVVQWRNEDTSAHSVATENAIEESPIDLDSVESLGPTDSYSYTFAAAGTYEYYDPADKSKYRGIVIVE